MQREEFLIFDNMSEEYMEDLWRRWTAHRRRKRASQRERSRFRQRGETREFEQKEPASRAVVVSADPVRRQEWSGHFERLGLRAIPCVGPLVTCALLEGRHCPLLDEADVAVYDVDSLTPAFIVQRVRCAPSVPVLFARDELAADGTHRPAIERSLPPARGSDTRFRTY